MILDTTPTILRTNPQFLLLVNAYLDREIREKAIQDEFSGWLERINKVEGIDVEEMSRIHGKLISLGLLKFELGDRLEGIRYQVSDDARRALKQLELSEVSNSQEDEEVDGDDDLKDEMLDEDAA